MKVGLNGGQIGLNGEIQKLSPALASIGTGVSRDKDVKQEVFENGSNRIVTRLRDLLADRPELDSLPNRSEETCQITPHNLLS